MFKNYKDDLFEAHNNIFCWEYKKVWNSQSKNCNVNLKDCGYDALADEKAKPLTIEEVDRVNKWWLDKYPTLSADDFKWEDTRITVLVAGMPTYLKIIDGIKPIVLHTDKIKSSKYKILTQPEAALKALEEAGIVMQRKVKRTIKFGRIYRTGEMQDSPQYTLELLPNNEGTQLRYVTKSGGWSKAYSTIDPKIMSLICEVAIYWDAEVKKGNYNLD